MINASHSTLHASFYQTTTTKKKKKNLNRLLVAYITKTYRNKIPIFNLRSNNTLIKRFSSDSLRERRAESTRVDAKALSATQLPLFTA